MGGLDGWLDGWMDGWMDGWLFYWWVGWWIGGLVGLLSKVWGVEPSAGGPHRAQRGHGWGSYRGHMLQVRGCG